MGNVMTKTEDYNWNGRQRASIKKVYLTKMYYFWSGRNAWNWTWSSKYPGINAFHMTFENATDEIEDRRVQGSSWTIREMPAIVFVSDRVKLVVAEINTDTPFDEVTNSNLGRSITLKTINDAFCPRRPNSIQRFVIPFVPTPAELPFKRYQSSSLGSREYYLQWSPVDNSVDLQHACRILSHYTKLVQQKKA